MQTERLPLTAPKSGSARLFSAQTAWWAWATLTFSYPFLALFAEPGRTSGVPLVVIPAVLALMISAVLGFSRAAPVERAALVSAAVCFAAINLTVFLTADSLATDKFLQFNLVLLVFGAGVACSFYVKPLYQSLDVALVVLGLFALVALALNANVYQAGRITYGDSNPIWMGRILGFSCIGVFFLGVRVQRLLALWGVIGIALLVGIIMTGSRGPLLAVGAALLAGILLYPFPNKLKMVVAGVWLATVLVVLAVIIGGIENLRGLSLGGSDDVSYFIRVSVYEYTTRLIELFPQGIGVGNFFYQGFPYPHNIFLEFLAEWGRVAGGAYIVLIALGGIGLLRSGVVLRPLLLIYIFEVVNASVSGDITSPRFLYGLVMVGIAQLIVRRTRKAASRPVTRAPSMPSPGPLQGWSDARIQR